MAAGPVSFVLRARFASDAEGVGAEDAARLQEFETVGVDVDGVLSVSYKNPIRSLK